MSQTIDNRPYRKHVWDAVPTESGLEAIDRCRDCGLTRTEDNEDAWCPNPNDEHFTPFRGGMEFVAQAEGWPDRD